MNVELDARAEPDLGRRLAEEFVVSPYNTPRFEHWPLGRQVHAFLTDRSPLDDYETTFVQLYATVSAMRRKQAQR